MQEEIDKATKELTDQLPKFFEDRTGKFEGEPIKIQSKPNAVSMIQPTRRIPTYDIEPLEAEIKHMIQDDIIEGPLELEEPGTYISNLVITDKKWDPTKKHIRVTLD